MKNSVKYQFFYNCRSDFSAAWMNLGIVQAALHKYNEAETSYLTAIKHRHKYPDCFYNLGNLVRTFSYQLFSDFEWDISLIP